MLIALFLVLSCQQENKQDATVYLNKTETVIPIDSLLTNIDLIYLDEPDGMMLGVVNKIMKQDSTYYLLDSNKSKAIYAYNSNGNYISRFYSLGGGPREYFLILDFDVDYTNDEIALLCSPSKIIFTDLQLSFKREVPLGNNYYERISITKDDIFVFSYSGEVVERYNRGGELLNKTIVKNNLSKGNVFFPQDVFYKISDKHFMQSPGDDIIYIERDGIWVKYRSIDYDNKVSSEKLYSQKKEEDITFKEKLSNPVPYIKSIFEYKQETYILYLYGVLHYLNDGSDNFFFSELPGVASLNYDNGHFYTWEYLSNFNLGDPILINKLQNIKIDTFGRRQENELEDGILIIDYLLKS